jgi:hypothetical protein
MDCLVYLRSRPDRARGATATWLRETFGPDALATYRGLQRCDVLIGRERPSKFRFPDDMELKSDDAPTPPYDGALILAGEPSSIFAVLGGELVDHTDLRHAYSVTGTVMFDKGLVPATPTVGIKFLLSLRFFADMSPTAARRAWANHGPLARTVHIGANRYVQWWVDARLSPDAPPLGGIVELHFPTEDDLVDRFFDSPRGEMEIVQDTADFIAGGHPRVYLEEYAYRR